MKNILAFFMCLMVVGCAATPNKDAMPQLLPEDNAAVCTQAEEHAQMMAAQLRSIKKYSCS